jgi:SnoaL-like domain
MDHPKQESVMSELQRIAENYIRLWNEPEPALRRRILEDGWTAEATYTDPLAKAVGHEQINALVGSVQQRFPGFIFELIKGPDGYGDHLRFGWSLGPGNAERLIEGSDVVTTRGGRIASVIGFLDRVPPQG